MSVLTAPRPTQGYVERNGPFPRRGGIRGNPTLQEVDGPLTGSGAVAIATDVGDTVLLDPASTVATVGTITSVGTVGTVTTVGTVAAVTDVTNPVTVETDPGSPLDIEPHAVNVRVSVSGTPTLATGATAGATVPLHILPVDTSGNPNPRRNVSLQDTSGNDLSTVTSGSLRSVDVGIHDGAGNRIGSTVSASKRGEHVYVVNQSSTGDVIAFTVTDPGGSGSQAAVLTIPGTSVPAGTKGMAIFDPHLGQIRGSTAGVYAEVQANRDDAPASTDNPLLTKTVPTRFGATEATTTVTAAGNTTVVTGIGGFTPHVRKISAALTSGAAAVDIGFRFGAAGTIRWKRELRTNMQLELDFPPDRLWKGASGDAVVCNLSAASSVEVTILYDGRASI